MSGGKAVFESEFEIRNAWSAIDECKTQPGTPAVLDHL
jgi:hypothetical protein